MILRKTSLKVYNNLNCNFTARIISLLYIYPQFTYELLHILHAMYLHIWRRQTIFTFHGLRNWKSSHWLQLWKRFLQPNDKWKTVWHARPKPTAVSGLLLLMIIPLNTLHAFHSNKFTLIVTVYEKLAREALLVDMRSQSWTSRH